MADLDTIGETTLASLEAELRGRIVGLIDDELTQRELRDRIFGRKLSQGPSWDMLLALYKYHLEERPISVTAVASYGRCPQATAIRQIAVLMEAGLIFRHKDMLDRRRKYVGLTRRGISQLRIYFAERQPPR